MPDKNPFFAHETATIDNADVIGAGTKIWHYSHVMAGAQVGANCIIGQNVYVDNNAIVGDGCKIQNNVSVYSGVVLEEGVFCGPSMVFTNVINPRAFIERKSEFKTTTVQEGATLGANATILCGTTVGRYALIGAGSVVTKDVPPHALIFGVPGRQAGWICRCGITMPESLSCSSCGAAYVKADGGLEAA